MERAERSVIVRGRLTDSSHIELDEPVSDIHGAVEVAVRPIEEHAAGSPAAILKVMRGLPILEPGDVDELERMIEANKMTSRAGRLSGADKEQGGPLE
jgi:hypothetical protein